MTNDEHMEDASGIINGFNDIFYTSLPYTPGTLFIYLDGIVRVSVDDDGWIESDPLAGEFQMRSVPMSGSRIFVRYIEG